MLPDLGGRIYSCGRQGDRPEMFYANPSIKYADVAYRGAWVALGRRVQLPRLAQLDDGLAGGLRHVRHPDGSASVWVGNIDRPYGMQWRVELTPAARPVAPRADHDALQPQRRAPPLLLVDDGLGPRRRRLAHPLPDGVLRLPPLRRRRHLARGLLGRRPQLPAQPRRRLRVALRPRQPRAVHGRLPPARPESGMVHVADHHDMPGKKIWSWGWDDEGKDWRRALSDDQSAYLEVQAGLFRNQETYAFLEPQQLPALPRDLPAGAQDRRLLARERRGRRARAARGDGGALRVGLNVTRAVRGGRLVVSRRDGDGARASRSSLAPSGRLRPRPIADLTAPGPVHRRGARREGPRAPRPHRGPLRRRAEGRGEDRPAAGARLPAAREAERGRLGGARPPPGAEREAARGPRRLRGGARRLSRQPGAQPGRGTPRRRSSSATTRPSSRSPGPSRGGATTPRPSTTSASPSSRSARRRKPASPGTRRRRCPAGAPRRSCSSAASPPARGQVLNLLHRVGPCRVNSRPDPLEGLRLVRQALAEAPEMIRAGGMEVALLRRTGRTERRRRRVSGTGGRWTRRARSCATRRCSSVPRTRRSGRTSPPTPSASSSWPSTTWRSACGTTPTRSSRGTTLRPASWPSRGWSCRRTTRSSRYYRGYCAEKAGRSGREDFALASRQSTRYVFPNRPESLVVLRRAVEVEPAGRHRPLPARLAPPLGRPRPTTRSPSGRRRAPSTRRSRCSTATSASPCSTRAARRTRPCVPSTRGWARTPRTSSSTRAPTRR